jgi:two-component system, chemotaxis family, sensor kinase CheA
MFRRLPIKLKLILLAGVPVVGALLLSYMVAKDAYGRLQSAKALGSIEDLAVLATTIGETVDEVQQERAVTAYALGRGEKNLEALLLEQRQRVDAKARALRRFFEARDTRALPPRLAGGIRNAEEKLDQLGQVRASLASGDVDLEHFSKVAAAINGDLIGATAALRSLSNDGAMLRNISGLVTVMELKERASREQALLVYVFAKSEYPPGAYKEMVNLVTEQTVFEQVLHQNTSPDLVTLYEERISGKDVDRAAKLRQVGLDTMDDKFGVDPQEWLDVQGNKVDALRMLTIRLNERVREAALLGIASAKSAVKLSFGVAAAVLLLSLLLAVVIATGIHRAIRELASTAHQVQHHHDFGVRAKKQSDDELGALTDAFNHMLDGIQKRDGELAEHRANLEATVEARTAELATRNEAMRVVLDNVEQGLATIKADGSLDTERSAMFNNWFPIASGATPLFSEVLAADEDTKAVMDFSWDALASGILPRELAADQIPRKLRKGDQLFELSYKPMGTEEDFRGALLVINDVTALQQQKAKEAEQRELIAVFEAVTKDRTGFIQFFEDAERMVNQIASDEIQDDVLLKRVIHTLKGNSAMSGVLSLSDLCHRIESGCQDELRRPSQEEREQLHGSWHAFAARVRSLTKLTKDGTIEVQPKEFADLLESARTRKPHEHIVQQLEALENEPTEVRFGRVADQIDRLSKHVGKKVQVEMISNGTRLPAKRWDAFWNAFVHVVRNALDHGIEASEQRLATGKAETGLIRLVSRAEGAHIVIEISDDGAGVDWERIRAKAEKRGLPAKTEADLTQALFTDGISSRDEASELSGRGVGMPAVKEACEAMGGVIAFSSEAGRGTTVRFEFPAKSPELPGAPQVTAEHAS